MAITKIGSSAALLSAVGGGATGVLRAQQLSEEEKDYLRKKYFLDEDAHLPTRNMVRGAVGAVSGALSGALLGGATALALRPQSLGSGSTAGALLGVLAGARTATNKYSKDRVARLKRYDEASR